MNKILVVGVFDYFHYGHLRLFEQAKSISSDAYLVVAVQKSEFIKKYKPNANIFYSTDVRCQLVGALRCVDEVITYTDVAQLVKCTDFDVFAVGADQNHQGFMDAIEYCQQKGKRVVHLKRTPNISSSSIKSNLFVE